MQITIIVPVYKVENYIHRCVDSILAQSFADFELILVDDGSPDRSGAICDEYAAKDSRIRVIHQENQGQAAARNRALDIANGQYIAFVDSDDWVHPRFLEILWGNLQENDAQISICGHKKVFAPEPAADLTEETARCWPGDEFVRKCMTGEITNKAWILCDKLFCRDCFANIRMPEGRVNEDNAVVYKILYEAKQVVECDVPLYFYFQNPDSTVNQTFRRKHLDWLLVPQEMITYFTHKADNVMVDKSRRMYLGALEDMLGKVRQHLNEPTLEKELRGQLLQQYRQEKKRYPITIKTHPGLYEQLFPVYSRCYWLWQGIKNKLRRG